jgi:hypothetical protein
MHIKNLVHVSIWPVRRLVPIGKDTLNRIDADIHFVMTITPHQLLFMDLRP